MQDLTPLYTPYTRKVFHFMIFTMASIIQLSWRLPGVIVFGCVVALIVLYAVWRGDGHPLYEALARPTDAPRRTLFVVVPLFTTITGGLASNALFPGSPTLVTWSVAGAMQWENPRVVDGAGVRTVCLHSVACPRCARSRAALPCSRWAARRRS